MPYIPVANTVQAEIIFTGYGQVFENVLNFRKDGGWTATEMAVLGSQLVTWWTASWRSSYTDDVTLQKMKFTDLSSQTGTVVEYTAGMPLAGLNATEPLPLGVAVVISMRTALRGRSYRGRNYISGLTGGAVEGNNVVAASAASFKGFYEDLIDGVTINPGTLVVVSRQHDNIPRTTGVTTDVTHFVVDTYVDSQRRRLSGRGQ